MDIFYFGMAVLSSFYVFHVLKQLLIKLATNQFLPHVKYFLSYLRYGIFRQKTAD